MLERALAPSLRLVAAGQSDIGRKRKHNEDTVLVEPDLGLFAVFDGVGGHSKGDIASALAAVTVDAVMRDGSPPPTLAARDGTSAGARKLLGAVVLANEEVVREGGQAGQKGMGSTAVVASVALDEGSVHICHAGDSRCYRVRDGVLEQLTEDHNLVNDALRLDPNLPPELLRDLPKNAVTRALGMKPEVEPDLRSEEARPGDLFLLCSDGLTGMVSDPQIAEVLQRYQDLAAACAELIRLANAAGGVDNVSAVLVRIEADAGAEEPTLPPPDSDTDVDIDVGDEPTPEPVGEAVTVGRIVDVAGLTEPFDPLPPPAPAQAPAHCCASCRQELQHGARFCGACGATVPVEARCGTCGAELFAGTFHCVSCGAPHNLAESLVPPDA